MLLTVERGVWWKGSCTPPPPPEPCLPPVAGVLDEPYSQLIPLSGVAVQARQSISAGTVSIHPM